MSPSVVLSLESAASPQILAHGGRAGGSIYQPAPNVHIALTRSAAEQAQLAAAGVGSAPSSTTNMTYHSGPTQQTLVAYTIFWSPHSTLSSSYRTLINRYFQDIGGSSFYNVVSQYPGLTDTQNVSTLGGTWIDTNPYPAGKGTAINPLSATDIENEVTRALSLNSSWNPAGLGRMYFVYTESGIESCFDPTAAYSDLSCTQGVSSPATKQYCAYHSVFGTINNPVIYGNMPYGETWPWGCRTFSTSPNGDIAADEEVSLSSHEQFEAVTDPLLDAWFDSDLFGEIGDKCAYIYGSTMPDGHNLTLNGHPYIVQQEWSNANNDAVTPFSGCVDSYGAFNFRWYADKSANPADPSVCDLSKPIPPDSPYATGLCASFDLQLPDGNYSLREILQLDGSIFSDYTFPTIHLYSSSGWQLTHRGLSAGGTYSLILYANGVLLGSGSVTVSGTTPTPSPTPSPTPQWSATNFHWYEITPSLSGCDPTKPIPPGNAFAVGLCATWQLQIPDANYTLRTVWKRDGTTVSDNSYPNFHLYAATWDSWLSGIQQAGTYSVFQYANGVLLGTGQLVITGGPTPTPSQTPTPTPTHSPTPTPSRSPTPSPTSGTWSASNFHWYEAMTQPSGGCDLTKPIPPGSPFPPSLGLCAEWQLQIPDGTYTLRTVWTQDGTTLYDYSSPNSHLYPGTWNNWVNGLLQSGTYSLALYANGVFLGTAQVVITSSPTLGNANCDNRIDGADVIAVLTNSSACPHNADVDGDGHITPFDALLILKYWAGLITTFPAGG